MASTASSTLQASHAGQPLCRKPSPYPEGDHRLRQRLLSSLHHSIDRICHAVHRSLDSHSATTTTQDTPEDKPHDDHDRQSRSFTVDRSSTRHITWASSLPSRQTMEEDREPRHARFDISTLPNRQLVTYRDAAHESGNITFATMARVATSRFEVVSLRSWETETDAFEDGEDSRGGSFDSSNDNSVESAMVVCGGPGHEDCEGATCYPREALDAMTPRTYDMVVNGNADGAVEVGG